MFIKPDAIQGSLIWLQKGHVSKAAVVLIHGVSGLSVGSLFKAYFPDNISIILLQAPDLVKDVPIFSLHERALYYKKLLESELNGKCQSVHLVGYSFGGALAFELALCMNDSSLVCGSLSLIDPVPYGRKPKETKSYLMRRAEAYDFYFSYLLSMETTFRKGVILTDIVSISELETHVMSATSKSRAHEISRCVDTMIK